MIMSCQGTVAFTGYATDVILEGALLIKHMSKKNPELLVALIHAQEDCIQDAISRSNPEGIQAIEAVIETLHEAEKEIDDGKA